MKKMARTVLFAVMAVFSTAVFAEDVDPCATPENLTVNDGVYQIGTCGDLYKFAEMVNNGETSINGRLTADIVVNENLLGSDNANVKDDGTFDVEAYKSAHANAEPKVWTPVGTFSTLYAGTFDGNGKTISGLYFNDENVDDVGLFGLTFPGAVVQNVGVVDSYFVGRNSVGGVVGDILSGGTVSNVYNTGVVSGNNSVGGVVGRNSGTVSNVYNTGAVSGNNFVGGVVGFNVAGTVSNVYNTGTVNGSVSVGGLIGENYGDLSNVFSVGSVNGGTFVGGVVGYNDGPVANAYYSTDLFRGSALGHTIEEGKNVKGKTTAELTALDVASAFENSDGVWNSGYSITSNGWWEYAFPSLKGVGTALTFINFDPNVTTIEISNADELFNFAVLVNAGNTALNARLTADIIVNENLLGMDNANVADSGFFDVEAYKSAHANAEPRVWTPIGTAEKPYAGTFDGMDAEGNAHVISGLYFNDENVDYVGLFGSIGENAQVQNVGVEDSYFRGLIFVGGVVGCNADGTIGNVYNTGAVSGKDRVGGVVGSNRGDLSNVYSTGAVSGTKLYVGGVVGYNDGTVSNVYNTGTVSGTDGVGGVVGYNDGTVSNVYNTGTVSGTDGVGGVVGFNKDEVSKVYNIGIVKGEKNVGGVVGVNRHSVRNVYSTGAVSGVNFVGGVIGYEVGRVEYAYFNTDFFKGNALGFGDEDKYVDVKGMNSAELATLDVATAFYESDGVWNAGYSTTSNGWWKYAFPSLKGVGTAPTFTVPDPNATEVEISNADELFKFAELVNAGNTTLNGKLTADIVVNEGVLKADGTLDVADASKFIKWTPIGTASNPYTGTFDGMDAEGNAHVISGLYFNDETADSVGLFGSTGKNAKVQNVGVEDSYFRGGDYVGVVVGFVREGGEISKVYSKSIVSGEKFVGGVIGYNDASIVSDVYNAGSVSGTELYVGGVVGGVDNKGSVSNVYNMGSVGGTRFIIGGVVGFDNSVIISNAYFNTDFFTGNALGSGEDVENVEGKTSVELAAGATLKLDTTVWVVGVVSENAKQDTLYYPYLKVFGPHEYELSDVKKYTITVAVNDEAMGTVSGAGEYEYGTEVELSATAKKGYKFVEWSDGVKDAKRTITVKKTEKLTATFEKESKKDAVIVRAPLPQFSVTASGKIVSIAGARPNSVVNVFDMQGNMVKTVVTTAANLTFTLPSAGVYIVKNGYTAKRVNVR